MHPSRSMRKYFFFIAAAVLLLDRLAKWSVASNIPLHESVTVIPGCFHLTHVENPGAAFGLFAESTAQWRIGAPNLICSGLKLPSRLSESSLARISELLSGVLSSCDMLARNSDL